MWLYQALHVDQNATTTYSSSHVSSMFKHVYINKDNISYGTYMIKELGILEHTNPKAHHIGVVSDIKWACPQYKRCSNITLMLKMQQLQMGFYSWST